MSKEYIKDRYGHVQLCTSNLAKMNLLEAMYYHRFAAWENFNGIIAELIDNIYLIREIFFIIIYPIIYPLICWFEIHKARKKYKIYKTRKME